MSLSNSPTDSLLAPLKGKSTTFMLDDRETNIFFARTAMSMFSKDGTSCTVVDLDALYSTNAWEIFGGLPEKFTRGTVVMVPRPGVEIEEELPSILASNSKVIIFDSLNTLSHILGANNGSTRARKLAFVVAVLSYLARKEMKFVFFSMYRRRGPTQSTGPRTSSNLSDATVSVMRQDSHILFTRERGQLWPGGRLSTQIP